MTDPFCSREEIAKTSFHQSKHFMALYNIRPVLPGHSLFVPKRHVTRITDLTGEEAMDLNRLMREVIPVLIRFYGSTDDSYNLAVQAGPSSGRTIDHLHIHIIPRRSGDHLRGSFKVDITESRENLGPDHVKKEVERLRKRFRYKME